MIQFCLEIVIALILLCFVGPKVEIRAKANLSQIKALQNIDVPRELPKTKQKGIIDTAKKYIGTRYDFGGTSFETGVDCSYFVQYVYKENGINLPRTTALQYAKTIAISNNQLICGDLVFFQTYTFGPSHVGIYLCDGKFVHASSFDEKVTISRLADPIYSKRYIGARRIPC